MMRYIISILFTFIIVNKSWSQTILNFNPIWNDKGVTTYKIDEFRFYISKVKFILRNGESIHDLAQAHLLQIDEKKIPGVVFSQIERERIASIQLTIGTDSLMNVSGILDGDLDPILGMYWAWNTGYINTKIEGSLTQNNQNTQFEYHIGGYLPPFQTSHEITLDVSKTNADINIRIDLDHFLTHVNIENVPSVLIPGKKASELSNHFKNSFSIEK